MKNKHNTKHISMTPNKMMRLVLPEDEKKEIDPVFTSNGEKR